MSLAALTEASAFIATRLDHPLPSRYAQAVAARGKKPRARNHGPDISYSDNIAVYPPDEFVALLEAVLARSAGE